MKFLCVCRGGNVRSAALAYVLHDLHDQEAIAVGCDRVSEATMLHFGRWADTIVVMQQVLVNRIPPELAHKVRVLDVGEDRYGLTIHPELLEMVKSAAVDWKRRGFKL